MTNMTSVFCLTIICLLSAVVGSGCQDSISQSSKTPDVQQKVGDQVAQPKLDTPAWGGLTVYRLGVELANASHVVILMHGLGGTGQDLVPLAKVLTVRESTCFILPEAPNGLARGGRAWVRQPADIQTSRDKVLALLKFIKQENPKAEIILGGFSQGAILASTFLEKDANLVDALVLLSPSGLLPDELTGEVNDKPLVFLSHGRNDAVLPFQGSETLQKKLGELNYQVDWLPFEGGHTIPNDVVAGINQFLAGVQAVTNGK